MKAPAFLILLLTTTTALAQIAMPPETLARIREKAAEEWPDDFAMQKYEVEKKARE